MEKDKERVTVGMRDEWKERGQCEQRGSETERNGGRNCVIKDKKMGKI